MKEFWACVREYNLFVKDHCDLCGTEMLPGKIWHVETRAGECFCCSLEHAKEAGTRIVHWGRYSFVDVRMSACGLATEEEYIDYFGLRPFLLPDEEILALRNSFGFGDEA